MFINQGHFTKKCTCPEPGNRKLTRPPSHSPLGQHDSCPCRQSTCLRAAGISPLPHHCPKVTPSLVPTDRRYLSSATGSSPLNPENVLCLLIPLLFLASLSVSFPSLLHLPFTPQSPEIQLSPFLYTEATLAKITALTSPQGHGVIAPSSLCCTGWSRMLRPSGNPVFPSPLSPLFPPSHPGFYPWPTVGEDSPRPAGWQIQTAGSSGLHESLRDRF